MNNSRLAIAMRFRQAAKGADFFDKMEAAVMFMLCETAQFDVDNSDLEQLIETTAQRMRKNWGTFVEAARITGNHLPFPTSGQQEKP